MKFIKDKRGRIPFAVLGVFLLVGSAVTSGVITGLDREHSKEIPTALEVQSVRYMVKYAEADISRALAYSCLQALKQVGETPVTYSDLSTQAARDYADSDGKGGVDANMTDGGKKGVVDTYEEVLKFNENWARNMARVYFNEYLNSTFRHNIYQDNGYAINIFDPENNGAVDDWRDIKLHTINMSLKRKVQVDILISEKDNTYPTYWEASIKNFEVEVCNLSSGKSFLQSINVSCFIPSRLPLMMGLTETYSNSINGISPLMGLTTVIGEGYTEVRSLLQYAGKYDWVANIVDNRWLQYLTNAGLIGIQYLVFNSIDPMALVYLAININDLISKGNVGDADKYVRGETEDLIKNKILTLASLPINDKDNLFKTFGNGTDKDAKNELDNLTESEQIPIGNVSIWNLSKDILYKTNTTYYYYNDTAIPKLILKYKWEGYNFTENGYNYHLSTKNGDPDENTTVPQQSFVREYLPKINSSILKKISEEIYNTYKASFETNMEKTKIGESYSRSFSDRDNWSGPTSYGNWNLVSSTPDGSVIHKNEMPSIPYYEEKWTLNWEREETWKHRECHTEQVGNGSVRVCNWINYTVTHYYTENAVFSLTTSDYPGSIENIFYSKSVFGNPPHEQHIDDNLEFLLKNYLNNHFIYWRDYYTDTTKDAGMGESKVCDTRSWYNNTADDDDGGYNKVSWILGQTGNVGAAVVALQNITEMIRDDRDKYSNISNCFYSGDNAAMNLSVMEDERRVLLDEFRRNEPRYINEGYYMNGSEYKSAAAKVILDMRKWFVNKIEEKLSESNLDMVEEKINERLNSTDTGNFNSYKDYKSTTDKYKNSVSDLGTIQFGNRMKLSKKGGWNETVSLAISSTPDYFDFNKHPSREEHWQFNVKNICLFGPTGLPLLPTPVTPWIVTINCWYIHVDGHWDTFKVLDSSDETQPDPLLGHRGQVYIRERGPVFDSVCYPKDAPEIGQCTRLNFGFDTMSLGIVPPGKLPIGDLGNPVESNSVGS